MEISTAYYKGNQFSPDGITVYFSYGSSSGHQSPKYTNNSARYTFSDIIGENELMTETVKRGKIASLTDRNMLIQGESGVGKDVFAQAIHNCSSRSQKPFVAINCAAFSKSLLPANCLAMKAEHSPEQSARLCRKFEVAKPRDTVS